MVLLLDTGAAVSVVMSCLALQFTPVYPSLTCAASTADEYDLTMTTQLHIYFTTSDICINVRYTPSGVALATGVTSVCNRCEGGLLYN